MAVPFHLCKTIPLQVRLEFLQDITAGRKLWEGRLLASVLKITHGRFPCPQCTVCIFTGSLGTIRCRISQVVISVDLSVITPDNYSAFIPQASSHMNARALYAAMGPGPYVFLRLVLP